MRRKAHPEHDGRSPDEEELTLLGREEVAGDVLNPTVGAELNRANQGMGDEEHEKEN